MSRRSRNYRLNSLHHVMLRGVNGETIFYDEIDRNRFCLYLQEGCTKNHINVHGFCFMSNHVHLILEPIVESISKGIHAFTFRYAQYFNKRYGRQGHLFQNRFKSIIVTDRRYAKRLIRYVHMNPVHAHLVPLPEHYRWSSYRSYLGLDHFTWLNTNRMLSYFGDQYAEAIQQLIEFSCKESEVHLDQGTITQALEKNITSSSEIEDIEWLKFSGDLLFYKLCSHYNITLENLKSDKKNEAYVHARTAFVFIGASIKKWSNRDMAKLLGKSESTISRLLDHASRYPELFSGVVQMIQKEETQV